ncbi:hypothetical protein RYA60_22670, partial [Pseudomonas syringae]|nr:hypothetical protein [Pseudomonas syringae]
MTSLAVNIRTKLFNSVKVISCGRLSTGKSIVVVRPIDTDFPPSLSTQDGLYTTIISGLNEQGETVRDTRIIRSVNREINIYHQFDEYLALARDPNIRFVFSNTTEAGISYVESDRP